MRAQEASVGVYDWPHSQESTPPPRHPRSQVMSIEEVERILDETQEAVEYQRVGGTLSSLPPTVGTHRATLCPPLCGPNCPTPYSGRLLSRGRDPATGRLLPP